MTGPTGTDMMSGTAASASTSMMSATSRNMTGHKCTSTNRRGGMSAGAWATIARDAMGLLRKTSRY